MGKIRWSLWLSFRKEETHILGPWHLVPGTLLDTQQVFGNVYKGVTERKKAG